MTSFMDAVAVALIAAATSLLVVAGFLWLLVWML